MIVLTPFAGSSSSNLPIQNRFAPLVNSSPQPMYSQLIQRPIMYSPTTPSKKETLVSLGSPKFVSNTPTSSSNASNTFYTSNPKELFVSILEEEEV